VYEEVEKAARKTKARGKEIHGQERRVLGYKRAEVCTCVVAGLHDKDDDDERERG